ncbi:MAG: N-acetyltransferase [Carnobacterium sp.]
MDIYKNCPIIENESYKIRLIEKNDSEDLLKVYGDKNALPFFNSDGCNGSNFYCARQEDLDNAIKYWLIEYHETQGFVRFSIVNKHKGEVIGTIEMFKRQSEDFYNHCGVLRLDVRSDYEKSDALYDILDLFINSFYEYFECENIITKAAVFAVERIEALEKMNFVKSEKPLLTHYQNREYYDYWIRHQKV